MMQQQAGAKSENRTQFAFTAHATASTAAATASSASSTTGGGFCLSTVRTAATHSAAAELRKEFLHEIALTSSVSSPSSRSAHCPLTLTSSSSTAERASKSAATALDVRAALQTAKWILCLYDQHHTS